MHLTEQERAVVVVMHAPLLGAAYSSRGPSKSGPRYCTRIFQLVFLLNWCVCSISSSWTNSARKEGETAHVAKLREFVKSHCWTSLLKPSFFLKHLSYNISHIFIQIYQDTHIWSVVWAAVWQLLSRNLPVLRIQELASSFTKQTLKLISSETLRSSSQCLNFVWFRCFKVWKVILRKGFVAFI